MQNPSAFSEFSLSETTLASLEAMGLQTATPIQQQAIPYLLKAEGDFIGLASTGTGKTAAFGIPLIEQIDVNSKAVQALILAPTRELALQVTEQIQKLGKVGKVKTATLYGGSGYRTQKDAVSRGAHIVIATPGRLVDFIEQGAVDLSKIKVLVLDEADEMISMGFQDDLEFILKATHSEDSSSNRAGCKTWLFSATMSREIRRVADNYLQNPFIVEVSSPQKTNENIEQIYYLIKQEYKREVLARILTLHPDFYGIIFCQTKMEVTELEETLMKAGFAVDSLHGDKQQREREYTLKRFRERKVQVLVATDVAARGLDVKELTHVINYSIPREIESYIHRIGRTGRNGQKGIAITMVSPMEVRSLKRLEAVTKAKLVQGKAPKAEDVALNKISSLLAKTNEISAEDEGYRWARELLTELTGAEGSNEVEEAVVDLWARFLVIHYPELMIAHDPVKDLSMEPPRRAGQSGGGRFDRGGGGGRGFGVRSGGGGGRGGPRRDRGGYERSERSSGDYERSDRAASSSADRAPRGDRPERAATGERRERRQDPPGIKRFRPSAGGSKPRSGSSSDRRRDGPRAY